VARVGLQGGLGGLAGAGEAQLLQLREREAGERVRLPGVAREDHVIRVGGLAGGVLLAEHGAAQQQHAVLDDKALLGAGGRGRELLGLAEHHVGVVEGAAAAAGEGGAGDRDELLGGAGLAGVVGVVEAVHQGAGARLLAAAGADAQGEQLAASGEVVGVLGDRLVEQLLGAGGVAPQQAQAGVHAQARVAGLALDWLLGQVRLGVVVGAGGGEGVREGQAQGLVGGGLLEGILQEGGGALGVAVAEGVDGGAEGGDRRGRRTFGAFLRRGVGLEFGDLDVAGRGGIGVSIFTGDLRAGARWHGRLAILASGRQRQQNGEQAQGRGDPRRDMARASQARRPRTTHRPRILRFGARSVKLAFRCYAGDHGSFLQHAHGLPRRGLRELRQLHAAGHQGHL
jgi:hypothetical protein